MDKKACVLKDGKLDFELLLGAAKQPELYSAGEPLFWDDPHISQQMLASHLDPGVDAASRNHKTIDKTVEWLVRYQKLEKGDKTQYVMQEKPQRIVPWISSISIRPI